jgi:20S proteasome alpha/beta subunit
MTLIVGLKSDDCIVVAAEQEESGGIAAKRTVTKLRLISGAEWAIVVGGAGDASLAEKAMRLMERKLRGRATISEQAVLDVTDEILDVIYTRYVDRDRDGQGLSLVIGAVCGDDLHLISTAKRVTEQQDFMAYAGIGADIGIYFIDRLHRKDSSWSYAAKVAGFTLQQANEACTYCGGGIEIYVLQRPPNPRWRSIGTHEATVDFFNEVSSSHVAEHLAKLIEPFTFVPELSDGYRDEHHPEPHAGGLLSVVIPLEFFPLDWIGPTPYQKNIDEIRIRSRDKLLQLGLLKNQSSAPPAQTKE